MRVVGSGFEVSLPAPPAAKAVYRFFDNPLTEHSVLAGHFAATAARVAANEGPILSPAERNRLSQAINPKRYRPGSPMC